MLIIGKIRKSTQLWQVILAKDKDTVRTHNECIPYYMDRWWDSRMDTVILPKTDFCEFWGERGMIGAGVWVVRDNSLEMRLKGENQVFPERHCEQNETDQFDEGEKGSSFVTWLNNAFRRVETRSSMYAAFQQVDPALDTGLDFWEEYKMAKGMK